MAALLRARAKQKVRRGTVSRFVQKGKKWVIQPPQSYAEDTTLPAGMMLVNRKVHADLVAKAATASSTSRPAPPSRPSLAPACTATESELMSTAAEPTSHAKIVADAMIPVDDVSVGRRKLNSRSQRSWRWWRHSLVIAESAKGNSRTHFALWQRPSWTTKSKL